MLLSLSYSFLRLILKNLLTWWRRVIRLLWSLQSHPAWLWKNTRLIVFHSKIVLASILKQRSQLLQSLSDKILLLLTWEWIQSSTSICSKSLNSFPYTMSQLIPQTVLLRWKESWQKIDPGLALSVKPKKTTFLMTISAIFVAITLAIWDITVNFAKTMIFVRIAITSKVKNTLIRNMRRLTVEKYWEKGPRKH